VLTLPRDLPPGQTPEAATGVVPTTGRRRLVVAAEAHKAAEREENRAYGQLLLRLISEERYREVALATREAS
jgi:hypothetical protein